MQDAITSIEKCRKSVIACVHGACIGGGVDIVMDLEIMAGLGSLQRLPGNVGLGNAMELALTARRFLGLEAKELGLVSKVFGCRD
ncbi:putative ClpP/crotonase-like domain superfamily [Helianthus annuus]|nr:putative ClpP/crotonase-like domain superfamily [Helianthus annuus]